MGRCGETGPNIGGGFPCSFVFPSQQLQQPCPAMTQQPPPTNLPAPCPNCPPPALTCPVPAVVLIRAARFMYLPLQEEREREISRCHSVH